MFQLNKQSLLVTVSADTKLSELKQKLILEGCYLGYQPLDMTEMTLKEALEKCVSNLYYYKFGCLADLVSTLYVKLNTGHIFHLKEGPKASRGPDFNQLFLGTKGQYGHITAATLRLAPIPETMAQGFVQIEHKEQARKILQLLVGELGAPLFFHYCDSSKTKDFAIRFKMKMKNPEVLVLCLTGLDVIVKTQQDILENWCQQNKCSLKWCEKKIEKDFLKKHIHTEATLKDIKEQYRSFFWPPADASDQTEFNKKMLATRKKPDKNA